MERLEENRKLILAHEEKVANAVAVAVIEKPLLSVWMVLVPVFFVYYFYQLKKYANGREDFARNFLITRRRSLDEAFWAIDAGRKPNVQQVVALSSAPKESHGDYAAWIEILVAHYTDLLRSEGDAYDALVRSVYRNRTNYLLFLNQVGQAEKRFNAALKPHLNETEDIDTIVRTMEKSAEVFRRAHAESVFS